MIGRVTHPARRAFRSAEPRPGTGTSTNSVALHSFPGAGSAVRTGTGRPYGGAFVRERSPVGS